MQNHSKICFIGLGSNLDNPKQQINLALEAIRSHNKITILKQSKLYTTKPYGYLDQNDFINSVIKITTDLSCYELLDYLKTIEHQQKRLKTIHWGPRTIDLDILAFGDLIINTKSLQIPHPDLNNRLFVLQPWAEIEPNWILPDGKIIHLLWNDLVNTLVGKINTG